MIDPDVMRWWQDEHAHCLTPSTTIRVALLAALMCWHVRGGAR